MENTTNETNFGIAHLWYQGDTVTHIVAIILLVMSIGSWFIIITRIISLYQVKPLVKEIALFWKKTSWQDGLNSFTKQGNNPFHQLAAKAHSIMQERQLGANQATSIPLANQIETDDWLSSNLKAELDLIIASLQKGLAFLASTGATAPFIGLFGTVWGIYHALMTIGSSGSASIDQVAGPIGEALVMTGLGLAVAIPAVLGYNALSKSNKDLLVPLRRFNDDLHTYLIQNERP
ncbi:transporter MotA/TolQ/ExbB proton channel family protein [Polynucleobacter sp. SHI8]|uniref:MotA/TolQ/ExbB proton channel family protein n=1 Tax=unclassified Polynucleobacter TaxID=2640945 RepID=UPI0024908569|nr:MULTISPECIES: MotA/TolQ/ExbB proton channel family protein [unclassified Polynucleobacter]BDW11327.1 transporter MotA/TolQ/ExbB proton channel family protein [Polynucleobacter sp. SHI2]BDW13774.1 transporter MotA/TolQ/ExbB proton channel family protein [Polynucleobacter sp. SHI8]